MRTIFTLTLLLCIQGCSISNLNPFASDSPTSIQTRSDSGFFEQYSATRRFTLGRPGSIKIVPDGSAVLFLRSGPRSFVQDLYEFDVATGTERKLLTADQILRGAEEKLSVEERARRERMRMSARGIARYHISKDGSKILVPLSGRLFVMQRSDQSIIELSSNKGFPIDARFSPDGEKVSCVRNGELYVTTINNGHELKLTSGSNEHVTNGLAEFVAQEEMGRFRGYWWSPDSQTIAYQRTDTSSLETMHIMDAVHPEKSPQNWPYPRPGKHNAEIKLGLMQAKGGETTWIYWDQQRYPYLATVKWKKNAPLTILVQNREQTEHVLMSVNTESGITNVLVVEKDDAWINLDQKMPYWLSDGQQFLWTTERNGAWQLELRDREGRLIKPLTSTDFLWKGLVDFDEDNESLIVAGGEDTTQTHLYRIGTNGLSTTPKRLTEIPGVHGAIFSKNHQVYVHRFSTMSGKRQQIIKDQSGKEIGRLQSKAEQPPFVPHVELTKVGRDPKYHAAIIRPRHFRSGRTYPVIVHVYGGPHGQMVQASPYRYLLDQWIADQGYIVVLIDGRGTPNRGRDWERIIKNNLIDIPLEDQVAALQMLGKKYRELDLRHVGIFGWSFGGYFSAMATMRRPDVFHAGVAGAPVCDWLDYDTHYTERYMGLPEKNAEGYKAANVLTYCKDLSRPLMIIHGTADDNVYFTHSLKMSNALFRAGKQHEFLVLSDFTHMVTDPLVTNRLYSRIMGFFDKHLKH